MKNLNTIPRIAGAFPNVTIVAETAPGAKDGTPLHSQWGNEIFSALQAILNGASLTPSGTVETCGATAGDVTGSQIVEALQLMLAVPGEIVGYPSDTIPTGARLLKCEGQVVSLATYPRLINVWCGAADNPTATAYYRTSDAGGTTRNIAGTYLVLDDMQGFFLRGSDFGALRDPQGASRHYGGMQLDVIKDHEHDHINGFGGEILTATGPGVGDCVDIVAAMGIPITTGHMSSDYGYTETRPKNTIVTWCIRY